MPRQVRYRLSKSFNFRFDGWSHVATSIIFIVLTCYLFSVAGGNNFLLLMFVLSLFAGIVHAIMGLLLLTYDE